MVLKMNILGVMLCLSIIFCLVSFSSATIVLKCNSGPGQDTKIYNQVFISDCYEPPCKFQKNSTVTVEILFVPEYDVSGLQSNVYVWVHAIPLPLLDVDGKAACGNLYSRNGSVKASCPVRKGLTYLYKNKIEIKSTYPKAKVVLHYALLDTKNNANIFCFEIPIRVVNQK